MRISAELISHMVTPLEWSCGPVAIAVCCGVRRTHTIADFNSCMTDNYNKAGIP